MNAEPGGDGFEAGQKGAVDEEEEMDVRESKAEEAGDVGERSVLSLSTSVQRLISRGYCSE